MNEQPFRFTGKTPLAVTLNGGGESQAFNANLPHLSINYYHFDLTAPNLRSLAFKNHPFAIQRVGAYRVSVQAFYRKQNSIWQYEHWSDNGLDEGVKSFCLDVKDERIEELVLVVSNDSPTEDIKDVPQPVWPRLTVSNVGCWRYRATASVQSSYVRPSDGAQVSEASDGVGTFTRTRPGAAPVSLPLPVPVTFTADVPNQATLELLNGTVSGKVTVTLPALGCTLTQDGTVTASGGTAEGNMQVKLGLDVIGGPIDRSVVGSASSSVPLKVSSLTCPDQSIEGAGSNSFTWLDMAPDTKALVGQDGVIRGNFTRPFNSPKGRGTSNTVFVLTPLREP